VPIGSLVSISPPGYLPTDRGPREPFFDALLSILRPSPSSLFPLSVFRAGSVGQRLIGTPKGYLFRWRLLVFSPLSLDPFSSFCSFFLPCHFLLSAPPPVFSRWSGSRSVSCKSSQFFNCKNWMGTPFSSHSGKCAGPFLLLFFPVPR